MQRTTELEQPTATAPRQASGSSPEPASETRTIASAKPAAGERSRHPREPIAETFANAFEPPADEASEAAVKPTPLSYPILVLPPSDDPHRIGLVRLLLVVSSEGKVADVIVTASTMSQDYVDLVTKSFEEMRFTPGTLRGAPHAGWYEVVVNFDFEPQGATAL